MPSTSKRKATPAKHRQRKPSAPCRRQKPRRNSAAPSRRRTRDGGGDATEWIAKGSDADVVLGVLPRGFHRR